MQVQKVAYADGGKIATTSSSLHFFRKVQRTNDYMPPYECYYDSEQQQAGKSKSGKGL